jgi:hypothetical protein
LWSGHEKEAATMKTMTCRQMGGACDAQFQGQTADDVIRADDSHLKEMVAGGDAAHQGALKRMQARWKNPVAGMRWYLNTRKAFAALPDD